MGFNKIIVYTMALLALVITAVSGQIVNLDDRTFEHQTQASSGMTTGSWLLFFKSNRCPHCKKLEPEYYKLSQDEQLTEQGIVLANVNVMESPRTASRFMIRGFPTLVYIHKHRLYRYNGKRDYEAIKEFLVNGIQAMEGEEIPPTPSQFKFVLKTIKAVGLELYDAALGKSGLVGYAIIGMVGMLMAIFIGIIGMFFMPAKKIKSA